MRRFAENATKLATEVGAREAGTLREFIYPEWLRVAGVGKILGPQQMAFGRGEDHAGSIAAACREATCEARCMSCHLRT